MMWYALSVKTSSMSDRESLFKRHNRMVKTLRELSATMGTWGS